MENKEHLINKKDVIKDILKRKSKDSIFTNLFSDKRYLLELYNELYPQDTTITKEDLNIITLEKIIVKGSYNDLGFIAKDKLIIFVEAQSTYSYNIQLRMFLYTAKTIQEYLTKNNINIHSNKQIQIPTPQFYVIYTGDSKKGNHILRLSNLYKTKKDEPMLELKVNIIQSSVEHKIIWQYIEFCKIFNNEVKIYGYTKEALESIIKKCNEKNILKEYLKERRSEVEDMIDILSQEYALEMTLKEEREEGIQEGRKEGRKEAERNLVKNLVSMNFDMDTIIKATGLDKETIESLIA